MRSHFCKDMYCKRYFTVSKDIGESRSVIVTFLFDRFNESRCKRLILAAFLPYSSTFWEHFWCSYVIWDWTHVGIFLFSKATMKLRCSFVIRIALKRYFLECSNVNRIILLTKCYRNRSKQGRRTKGQHASWLTAHPKRDSINFFSR